jgi:hypothetical protein
MVVAARLGWRDVRQQLDEGLRRRCRQQGSPMPVVTGSATAPAFILYVVPGNGSIL